MMFRENCFLTLTYRDVDLPDRLSLDYDAVPAFIKRLRKRVGRSGIRYYAGGEYGDERGRPHYHLCVFNYYPDDALFWKMSPCGEPLYTSQTLESVWGKGFVVIGAVSFESAAYIARYCVKKRTGKLAESHYARVDVDTGECYSILPERAWMSRMPGIGHTYLEQYGHVAGRDEYLVVSGRKRPLPRYYKNKLLSVDLIDKKKVFDTSLYVPHTSERRLAERLEVQRAKMNFIRRNLDE